MEFINRQMSPHFAFQVCSANGNSKRFCKITTHSTSSTLYRREKDLFQKTVCVIREEDPRGFSTCSRRLRAQPVLQGMAAGVMQPLCRAQQSAAENGRSATMGLNAHPDFLRPCTSQPPYSPQSYLAVHFKSGIYQLTQVGHITTEGITLHTVPELPCLKQILMQGAVLYHLDVSFLKTSLGGYHIKQKGLERDACRRLKLRNAHHWSCSFS